MHCFITLFTCYFTFCGSHHPSFPHRTQQNERQHGALAQRRSRGRAESRRSRRRSRNARAARVATLVALAKLALAWLESRRSRSSRSLLSRPSRRGVARSSGALARDGGLANSPATADGGMANSPTTATWRIRPQRRPHEVSDSPATADSPIKRITPSQCRFRSVSVTLETLLTRVVGMKRFSSFSSSFYVKLSHLLMWYLI